MKNVNSIKTLMILMSLFLFFLNVIHSGDLIAPSGEDIAAMKSANNVSISPDGRSIIYSLKSHDFDVTAEYSEDDTTAGWITTECIWIADIQTNQAKQITWDEKDRSPQWSPDGKYLAFIRTIEDDTDLMVIPLDGGESRLIYVGDLEPRNPKWSPDGSLIAFTAEVPATEEEKIEKWKKGDVEVYDEEWIPSQVWTVPFTGGAVKQITNGKEHITEFCWAPDGNKIAVMLTPTSSPYDTYREKEPCILSLNGGELTKLENKPLLANKLKWSPDGRYISFVMTDKGLDISRKIRLHDLKTGDHFEIVGEYDWCIDSYIWMPDSKSLLMATIDRTISGLYQVGLEGQIIQKFDLDRKVLEWEEPSIDENGKFLAFQSTTGTESNAIHILNVKNSSVKRVVDINPQSREWNRASVEIVTWINPEGLELEGVLYVTPLLESGTPPPLMVMPHGGPDGVSMEYFSAWSHFFAARGFSVFRPNYRGGIGYGFDFYASNRGRLGEIEWMDIESGVDHLIAIGKADSTRLVYGGWSWGGYLTAWAIGHTDRYKVAFVGAGVSDVRSQYVTSDINHGLAAEWEFNGNPWHQPENFEKANPVRFLENTVTPTLIVHGREDVRVDFMQGITLYRALKDVGCEVKFLAFPREPHGFKEPAHLAYLLNKWAEWYEIHLNN
jgi:dipeptidyl aminopeptidase/acylaminoacyl peptidase